MYELCLKRENLPKRLVQLVCTLCIILNTTEGACREPDDVNRIKADLQREIQLTYGPETSLFNNPDYLEKANASLIKLQPKLNSSFSFGKILHRRIYGQPSCRRARKTASGSTNTVCPSYIVLEYDSERLPSVIARAKCTCDHCFHPLALPTKKCGKKCWVKNKCVSCWKKESLCKEVNSYIPVIRRSCDNGVYVYGIRIEPLPVGCTCQNRQVLG